MMGRISRGILGGVAIIAIGGTSVPALAQSGEEQARIRKLEAEVRALQRQVFPGGAGRFFEPEITGSQNPSTNLATPSTTAVTDILARLDALEVQLQSLTSHTEENNNSLRLLTTRLAALEAASGVAIAAGGTARTANMPGTADSNLAAMTGGASLPEPVSTAATIAAPAAANVGPTEERLAAVQLIAKPQTDDEGDDEYSYGYRLWNAGFYPEAQQQLSLFVEQHPNHSRTTFGRNLLGRAYLDDGKPREAAPWFLTNYQSDKQSARAPDSLLFLGEAMIALNDTGRACIALAEFGETYPALAAGRLSDRYQSNLVKVDCN